MKTEGLRFDAFQVGQRFETDRRTITEADHVHFTTSFGFFEPLFMDRAYVEQHTSYQAPIVPGALTFSVAEGLTILTGLLHGTGIALLGVELTILKPVFIDDTIRVMIEVRDKHETSKPHQGVVTFRHQVFNQDDTPVMTYTVKRMIRRG